MEDQNVVIHLLGELARLRKAWTSLASSSDVSAAQFATMMHIAHGERPWLNASHGKQLNGGVTLSALARMERHSLPAASKRISLLEDAGLVRREVSREDRRITRVYLTDAGMALLRREQNGIGERVTNALNRLGEEKTGAFIRLTGGLADTLEQINLEE